jgi:hypothetical protein
VLRKISSNCHTRILTDVIGCFAAPCDEVVDAGLRLLSIIYGGRPEEKLNHMRFSMYMHQTATNLKQVRPERLPPTEAAARYHIMRAHFQVTQWKTEPDLNPEDWGWKLVDGKLLPVATDLEAAPSALLNVVRCKCKAESRKPCSSSLCSCRKNGLHCVAACKNCNGESCDNASPTDSSVKEGEDGRESDADADETDEETIDDFEENAPEECFVYDMPYEIYEEVVDLNDF